MQKKPVPGFEGYEIGDDGTMWSSRSNRLRKMKPSIVYSGGTIKAYYVPTLYVDGKRTTKSVSLEKLMVEAFGSYPNYDEEYLYALKETADDVTTSVDSTSGYIVRKVNRCVEPGCNRVTKNRRCEACHDKFIKAWEEESGDTYTGRVKKWG